MSTDEDEFEFLDDDEALEEDDNNEGAFQRVMASFLNRPRQMFVAFTSGPEKGSCYWTEMGDKRTHRQWFHDKGWPSSTIDTCVRGYMTADEIMLYKGDDFHADEEVVLMAIKLMKNFKRKGAKVGTPIYIGRHLLATLGVIPHKCQVAEVM